MAESGTREPGSARRPAVEAAGSATATARETAGKVTAQAGTAPTVAKKTGRTAAPLKSIGRKEQAPKKSAAKSATKKAASKQSAPTKADADTTAGTKSAARKSEPTRSVAKKSEPTKPETKRPARKPAGDAPASPESTSAPVSPVAASDAAAGAEADSVGDSAARTPAVPATGPGALVVREGEAPWSEDELAEVRAELDEEVSRLRHEIVDADSGIQDLLRDFGDGAGEDQADQGSKTFEREHEMSLANNARDMLMQAERALARMGDGSYGQCESCGNPIGKMRLQAFPRATLCMTCKQREERR